MPNPRKVNAHTPPGGSNGDNNISENNVYMLYDESEFLGAYYDAENIGPITGNENEVVLCEVPDSEEVNDQNIERMNYVPKNENENDESSEETNTTEQNQMKLLVCDQCDFVCGHPLDLEHHKKKHDKTLPYSCSFCGHRAKDFLIMRLHISRHFNMKPRSCPHCDFRCLVNEKLKAHIRTHTGERPYKCEFCPFATHASNGLLKHRRRHLSDKPFRPRLRPIEN